MWPAGLGFNVSRESADKLKAYHALLLKWQQKINLISPNTVDEAWVRHFADSAQIESIVSRESKTIADLGSGAGFPGMILAILRPDLEVNLIESDERKGQFLKTVSRETQTDCNVRIQRIEVYIPGFVPDLVTARALKDLKTLFRFVLPWAEENPDLECIFMKGAKYQDEIDDAREAYDFDVDIHPSITDEDARILHIKNLSAK